MVVIGMDCENRLRQILKEMEDASQQAYAAVEKRNTLKTQMMDQQLQSAIHRGMAARMIVFAVVAGASVVGFLLMSQLA